MPGRLLIILGPTAVGKTDFAISKALEVGSPVISCDSRQIFREMSIGTAVPSPEQLAAVKHYFIQTRSVTENYTAGDYEVDALALIRRLFAEGHETLVMTGGSMFYIDAVCGGLDSLPQVDPAIRAGLMERLRTEGPASLAEELRRLDPASYETLELTNGQRVVRALEVCIGTGKPFSSCKTGQRRQREFSIEKIGLNRPRAELYARIDRRVLQMMEAGLVDEVRSLLPGPADGGLPGNLLLSGRGYLLGPGCGTGATAQPQLRQAPAHLVAPGNRYQLDQPLGVNVVADVLRADGVAAEDEEPFYDVAQFADVARPRFFLQ